MTIDPRIGFWLSVVLAVIGVFAASTTQLTTLFGQHTAEVILALTALLMSVGNAVNAILHAMPAQIPTTVANADKFLLGPKSS
jgi:hypothetical protein